MLLAAVAGFFAALAAASPLDTALVASQTEPAYAEFIVYNFTAVCILHTSQCLYDFDVWEPGNVAGAKPPGQHCQALRSTDPNAPGLLPAVTDGTCFYTSRTWTVERGIGGGLNITVSTQVSPISFKTGSHVILDQELPLLADFETKVQRYAGPRDFPLTHANSGDTK